MKDTDIQTSNERIKLIEPDIERDAVLGVSWLKGEPGRDTLALMGVPDRENRRTTLEDEIRRVKSFIDRNDRLNWMIEYDRKVIGSVWVDLEETEGLPAPSVYITIGELDMRGKGVGRTVIKSVIDYLESQGNYTVYSRYLTSNGRVKALLESLDFKNLGGDYLDSDRLKWQNVRRTTL